MPLHNKHLHPRCPLLANAKISKILFSYRFLLLKNDHKYPQNIAILLKKKELRKKVSHKFGYVRFFL